MSTLTRLLKRPLVTEKLTIMSEEKPGAYKIAFEVDRGANKIELAKAFEVAFTGRKVTQVHTIKKPGYMKKMGRRSGMVQPIKKAVFTYQGEPIELIAGV